MSIKEKIRAGWERAKEIGKKVIKAPLTKQIAKTVGLIWLGYLAYWWLPVLSFVVAPEWTSAWHMLLKGAPFVGEFLGKALMGGSVGLITLRAIAKSWERYFNRQEMAKLMEEKIQRILGNKQEYQKQKEAEVQKEDEASKKREKTVGKGKKAPSRAKDIPQKQEAQKGRKRGLNKKFEKRQMDLRYVKLNNDRRRKAA